MDENVRALAQELLESGISTLNDKEKRVLLRIAQKHHVSRNVNASVEENMTFGERVADKVARWGGSWTFIICFFVFLSAWAILNSYWLTTNRQFDPYPYIFLNLILSMLASIQAPLILMSQNRQAERDRIHAAMDYEINLKAEMEILELHAKIDEITKKLKL
jgi:uncharacterized membrane protein